ncbi:hypothetical protein C8R46DRAFT_1061971 [Mycena filopes]|nr:hypothetical protein C8R46DRAFT_1061971 [Mycena filopes]
MDIPQELIDSIVAEIYPFADREPFILPRESAAPLFETLRACTLVSRAFVRPAQTQLFALVRLGPRSIGKSCPRFSQLLLESPHIAAYVKHLSLDYTLASASGPALSEILESLHHLEAIAFHPGGPLSVSWTAHPPKLKALFSTTFANPNLRRIDLVQYRFTDAAELHALLENAVGLKELELQVRFSHRHPNGEMPTKQKSPVVHLDCLRLREVWADDVDSLMQAFTTVEVGHLRSLVLLNSPAPSLVRANAATLQELEIIQRLGEEPDLFAIAEPTSASPFPGLKSLAIQVPNSPMLETTLRGLIGNGDITQQLPALQSVTLTIDLDRVHAERYEPIWRRIGTELSSVTPHLRAVEVRVASEWLSDGHLPELQTVLSGWMPALAERGVLSFHLL